MATESYYDLTNFRNVLYSLNIALETHFSNLLFDGDVDRIIYADDSNALRKRAKGQAWNNLYLPFLHYKMFKINENYSRPWLNHNAGIAGIWVPELQRKFKYIPLRFEYQSTYFVHRADDQQYAFQQLYYDNSFETTITSYIEIDGQNLELLAVLGYNLDYEPQFDEASWFNQNRIHSIKLDFYLDFNYIIDNTSGFCIPDQVIFNWGRILPDDSLTVDEIKTILIDHFEESTEEST